MSPCCGMMMMMDTTWHIFATQVGHVLATNLYPRLVRGPFPSHDPPHPTPAPLRCKSMSRPDELSPQPLHSPLACNADDVTLRHCSTFRPPRPVPLGKSRATDELGLGWQSPPSRRLSTAAASSSSKLQGVPQGSALISRPPGTSTFVIVDRGSLPSSIGRE